MKYLLSLIVITFSYQSWGLSTFSQPAHCSLSYFLEHQVKPKTQMELKEFGILRMHAFEFGKYKLVGLAVGLSVPSYVKKLALQNSSAAEDQKYCTWYFNKWNVIAEKQFNWQYLPIPLKKNEDYSSIYKDILNLSFDQEVPSFIGCLENHNYLAMGCNNMQHRGPSVFAMLLAFSGCSPETSSQIANYFWGLNGIPPGNRQKIAEVGYKLGLERPLSRFKLEKIFMGLK